METGMLSDWSCMKTTFPARYLLKSGFGETYLSFLGYNYGISGSIPAEIGNLKELEILNLYGNELSGEIPEELYSLPELSYLNLGVNNLSGAVT